MAKCSLFLKRHILPFWKTFIVILTPLLLLPLPLLVHGAEARAGYGVLLMTIFWLSSALPLAVTSLLPIVVFPLMDILSTAQVCALYFKESNVVFLGGVVLALGVERSNLHRRIALSVILTVGTNPRWLMLGFMQVGMLLSMWISNSGVTAMLIPIVEAVVDQLFHDSKDVEYQGSSGAVSSYAMNQPAIVVALPCEKEVSSASQVVEENKLRIRTPMILSVSYAASIGGAATLIGSGAPLAFKGILEELYGADTGISFATWMAVGVPVAIVNTLLSWLWLQVLFMGFCRTDRDLPEGMRNSKDVKASIRRQYSELGPITFYEKSIMFLFSLLIILWIFKDPHFMNGWEDLFPLEHRIGDATVAIGIVILAFILPAKPNFWCFRSAESAEPKSSASLLDWSYVQQKFPWNVLLLLGGGYAISDASKVSGLSHWIGHHLSALSFLPPIVIMGLMCLLASLITEVASNTATASILLPIVAQMGEATKINPLYLMIPVTISCCYAFMLPVGTPCNAMVLTAGRMKPADMMKAGAVMNVFTILVLCAIMETIGVQVFDLDAAQLPDWADGI